MSGIVIAFPKLQTTQNIRRILTQSGRAVFAAVTTGGAALESVRAMEEGILICGSSFLDLHYTELYAYLPDGVDMLLVAPQEVILDCEQKRIYTLPLPVKVHELLSAVDRIGRRQAEQKRSARSRPKVRIKEEQAAIDAAKEALSQRRGFSEEEAHRYLQKRSMENGTPLSETAQMVLRLYKTVGSNEDESG